jgi:hypothetical protein
MDSPYQIDNISSLALAKYSPAFHPTKETLRYTKQHILPKLA